MKFLALRCLIAGLVIFPGTLMAKEIRYKVSDIPKDLRENARSVVRFEKVEFEVKSISDAVERVTFAITVLNKNGIDDAYFTQFYDKFTRVSGISEKVYNEAGELVKRIPRDEIIDHSAISGFSIYEDYRVKYIDPKYRTIPFTVEYTYEISYNGILNYPSWTPYAGYNISTEVSSFKVTVPKGMKINYLEKNLSKKGTISFTGDNDIYYWHAENLKAKEYEPLSVSNIEFFPRVIIAPQYFKIDGVEGSFSSWKDFGLWFSKLIEGRDNLPEETVQKIKNLTSGLPSDKEKIQAIYKYMQNKVRYVSIQMGIGGWQPFEASVIDRLSYGDCKALTNYMKALLKTVNIDSKYCEVLAGNDINPIFKEFPSNQFNHAFLCVPTNEKDTLWLECTSQRIPCGYISDFTDDRDVLLVDGAQSKLVHTKTYSAEDNLLSRNILVRMDANGSGNAVVNSRYKGLNYDDVLPLILADDVDKKRMLNERIKLPKFELVNYSHTENKGIIPYIDEKLTIQFENYTTQAGNKTLVRPNFFDVFNSIPERVRNRQTDFEIRRPFEYTDTVVYEFPASLTSESIPGRISINSQFGNYSAEMKQKDGKLYYYRKLLYNKGRFKPESYADFLEFLEKITVADNQQFSLVKS